MTSIRRSTSKSLRRHAWCGNAEDIARLAETLEAVYEVRREPALRDGRGRLSDEGVDLLRKETGVVLAFTEGSDEVAGPVDDVLTEIDRRSIGTLKMEGKFPGYSGDVLRLRLARIGYEPGVALDVASPDPGWARSAFAQLGDEIEKGVPRWAWLRSVRGRVVLQAAASVVVYVTLLFALRNSGVDLRTLLIVCVPMAAIASLLILSERLVRWTFPPFEITGESGMSTGSRRLVYIASHPIALGIGILVNWIS